MKKNHQLLTLVFIFLVQCSYAQVKVLFDATKAETAGNADWVIDADKHDLGTATGGIMKTGSGNESDPQRYPTPVQSGITSSTNDTFWEGALSSWAIDLVNQGFTLETLPYDGKITYGDTNNKQDLANYKVYVVDEPNIRFTTSEKTAILNFVKNGGGLFMISDHNGSDRNNDGWDSPGIWNDLMNNNGSVKNPFGIHYDSASFSTTSYVLGNTSDSCLNGPKGKVTGMQYNAGTSMKLDTVANHYAQGLIFKSAKGTTDVMVARSRYGKGKILACGDSSPMDDGTGDPNDKLYLSYTGAVSNSHQRLCVNGVIWLAAQGISAGDITPTVNMSVIHLYPNPAQNQVTMDCETWSYHTATVVVNDLLGNTVNIKTTQLGRKMILNIAGLSAGIYFAHVQCEGFNVVKKFLIN